ncbi:MAG: hypothetical protein MUF27_07720 [Acidobacteria bacterium]|nr:hypothetical protein [Acidobacteriota bacterium]
MNVSAGRARGAALGTLAMALAAALATAIAAGAAPPPPKSPAAATAKPRPLALNDATDKALRAELARRGLKPSAVEPQLDALRAADPWVALVQGADRIGGAGAFAFVALDQAFARLGVPAAQRMALADTDDAADQLTALGQQMHLFDDPALGIPEAWRASFAQLAIDLARARQRAAEALAALPPAARTEIAAGMLPFAASGQPPRADAAAVDYGALARAAGTLLLATDAFLEQLPRDEAPAFAWRTNVPGVTGFALGPFPTVAGPMYLGGVDANGWAVPRDAILIDLGGPDHYGASGERYAPPPDAGLLVVLDLQGDDSYRPVAPGALAAGALGLSLLRDLGGNDSYEDRALGQGSAIFGVGLLLDEAGNDRYLLGSGGQGNACAGVGMLVDGAGDDLYLAGGLGQGAASGHSVGLLADLSGDDVYRATGEEVLGAAAAAAQGAGLRAPPEGARGTGILLDLAGDDVFLAARGAQGSASGGHGLLIDGGGNDFSSVGSDGQAGASGGGTAVLIDFGGDDVRFIRGADGQAAADGGAAVLLDDGGADQLRCGDAKSCRGVAAGDGRALFIDLGAKPSVRIGLPPKPAAAPAKEAVK